jgi:hypothetical protein
VADKDPMEAVEYELEEGRAYALGQAGRRLETALAALTAPEPEMDRETLLDEAAEAAWGYMIMRETAGFYDHDRAFGVYDVPPSVRIRIGVFRKR